MSCFVQLLRLDLRKGIVSQWRRYLACFVVVCVFSILNVVQWARFDEGLAASGPMTTGDLLVGMFAGRDFFISGDGEVFVLPYRWLLIVLLVAYLTLDYPFDDLQSVGSTAVVMGGSRVLWWLSKCCWVVASVAFFSVLVIAATTLVALCSGGSLSLDVSPGILELFSFSQPRVEMPWDTASFLLVVPVVLCALCLVQLLLSLFFHTLLSFMATVVFVFLAAYSSHGFLLGEYLMAARSSVFVAQGSFEPAAGLVLSLVMCVLAVAYSTLLFRKIDVYTRSRV